MDGCKATVVAWELDRLPWTDVDYLFDLSMESMGGKFWPRLRIQHSTGQNFQLRARTLIILGTSSRIRERAKQCKHTEFRCTERILLL